MCTTHIRRQIFRLALGQLFATREMLSYGSRAAVDQALCRLVKSGDIVRVARGVFVRAGSSMPSLMEIARVKARAFGKMITRHVVDVSCDLGLTTAGSSGSMFAVSGRSSSFRSGETVIHLMQAGSRKMHLGESKAADALKALWELGVYRCSSTEVASATRCFGRSDREEFRQALAWAPAWLTARLRTRRKPARAALAN